jgi:hypothetical protein
MSSAVRRKNINLAPKVYGYKDVLPNDIGAEVILLEKAGHLDLSWLPGD